MKALHWFLMRPDLYSEVPMDKQLETLPEFCERHSLSRTAAYREIREGRLQITKVGRRTLIARTDAEAWLDELRAASTSLSN